MNKKRQ